MKESPPTLVTQEPEETEATKPFDTRIQSHMKMLIRLTSQHKKASHQIKLLSEAKHNNRPPRGLIPIITPRLSDNPGTFILKWETILHHYNMPNHTEKDYKVIAVDREEDKNKRLRLEEACMSSVYKNHTQ
jgi:hypothetical protein